MTHKHTWIPLLALWTAFEIYWRVSAIRAKKNVRVSRSWRAVYVVCISTIIIIVLLVGLFDGIRGLRRFVSIGIISPVFSIAGLILCALGLVVAVWARVYLGRNWGMPMSVKERPELVTTGPYRYIRHPIYSGMLLAMLGSALVGGILWLIVVIFFGTYYLFSVRAEEHLMAREFPDQYPEYKKRTKALIPFVY